MIVRKELATVPYLSVDLGQKSSLSCMDVGTGGHRGLCLHFSKVWTKRPSSCSLVALLESFEDAKTTSKIHVSSDFRASEFQNFPGACPGPPLVHLHLGAGSFSSCKEFYRFVRCLISRQNA